MSLLPIILVSLKIVRNFTPVEKSESILQTILVLVCSFLNILTFTNKCFVHPIFLSWFLVTFGNEVTKILHNLCLHFARQGVQDEKKSRNQSDQNTKIQKTKIWGELNTD